MTNEEHNRRCTVLHEAAHAVVAAVLGIQFSRVSIDAAPHTGGYIRSKTPTTRAEHVSEVIMLLAGAEAERIYGNDLWATGARDDTDCATRSLQALGLDAASGEVDQYRAVAGRLVQHHWPAIQAVADALTQRGTLTGLEVRAILQLRGNPLD